MARRAVHAALLVCLLASLLSAQDFDLSDALDDFKDEKPTAKPRKPTADHDLNLEDALGGGGNDNPAPQPYPPRPKPDRNPNQPGTSDNPAPQPYPPRPKPDQNPNQPGTSGGGFSDKELADAVPEGGGGGGGDGGGSQRKEDEDGSPPGVVPGIVGAVVVAVAGAISSFIAYQKKKFCFKENAEQGDMNMGNHRGTNAEPAVQRTLLEK